MKRVAANIFKGMLIDSQRAEEIALAITEQQGMFELDRVGNLAGEDFNTEKSELITLVSSVAGSLMRDAIGGIANDQNLRYQPTFVVRYRPAHRESLETHIDRSLWTCVLYLNGSFNGGELVFPGLGLQFRPMPGLAVIFPGGELYPHRSNRVISGEKLALVMMAD